MSKLGRLYKRFQREAKRRPKEVVVLAVLAVVAGLVWGPRLVPSFGDDPQANAGESGVTILSAGGSVESAEEGLGWDQLVAWRRSDPAGWAGDDYPLAHDPFVVPLATAGDEKGGISPGAAPVVVSPEEVNLQVTAVLLRGTGGMAVISGRFVEVGQEIRAEADGKIGVFTLTEVHADHVVLESGGHRFPVALPGEKAQDDIEIVRAGPESD
ncbi:MAG: hypothetical protein D6741_01425 [Planctomycetota bacterium]|nr:MAG: hypothetical protein D6741_01425 [Planctomycetota bacterium]